MNDFFSGFFKIKIYSLKGIFLSAGSFLKKSIIIYEFNFFEKNYLA
jgi:hypothetical protein